MIEIGQEDITTLDVDAIVNAANGSLLGGGGVPIKTAWPKAAAARPPIPAHPERE